MATKGGGLFTRNVPVVFAQDSKYIIVSSFTDIKLYSARTGSLLDRLNGHADVITGMELSPSNPNRFYTSSLDGVIRVWEISTDQPKITLCESWDCGFPILAHVANPAQQHIIYILTQYDKESQTRFYINELNVVTGVKKFIKKIAHTDKPGLNYPNCLVPLKIDSLGEHLCIIHQSSIYIIRIKDWERIKTIRLTDNKLITAAAFHPTGKFLAYGDSIGYIRFSYLQDKSTSTKFKQAVLHWHFSEVRTLSFNVDGTILTSAGVEGVLVFWQIPFHGTKNFLAHLYTTINQLTYSPDSSRIAIACGDNSIRIIDPITFKTLKKIEGIKSPNILKESSSRHHFADIKCHPITKTLILNGLPGSVQFYDLETDTKVSELEVVPADFVKKDEFTGITNRTSTVEQIAIAPTSNFLATIDKRPDGDILSDNNLRFFKYQAQRNRYEPDTLVTRVHTKRVTGLAFHPTQNIVATCSEDSKLKLWVHPGPAPQIPTKKTKKKSANGESGPIWWFCKFVGEFKGKPARGLDFTSCGTLLAVAFGSEITLWDPINNVLLTSFDCDTANAVTSGMARDTIKSIKFIQHKLLVTFQHKVQLWNSMTGMLWWEYKFDNVVHVAVSQTTSRLAVLSDTYLTIFESDIGKPVLSWKVGFTNASYGLSFVDTNDGGEKLVYVDAILRISQLLAKTKKTKTIEPIEELEEEDKKTLYSKAFDSKTNKRQKVQMEVDDAEENKKIWNPETNNKVLDEMFKAPSHVIPNLDKMYESFMGSMLKKAESQQDGSGDSNVNDKENSGKVTGKKRKEREEAELVNEGEIMSSEFKGSWFTLNQQTYEPMTKMFKKTFGTAEKTEEKKEADSEPEDEVDTTAAAVSTPTTPSPSSKSQKRSAKRRQKKTK